MGQRRTGRSMRFPVDYTSWEYLDLPSVLTVVYHLKSVIGPDDSGRWMSYYVLSAALLKTTWIKMTSNRGHLGKIHMIIILQTFCTLTGTVLCSKLPSGLLHLCEMHAKDVGIPLLSLIGVHCCGNVLSCHLVLSLYIAPNLLYSASKPHLRLHSCRIVSRLSILNDLIDIYIELTH